jgi:3-oxoacyl-[acyl-carrier protein] reductase
VVTGAARGIGFEIAAQLLRAGADVYLDRDAEEVERAASELGAVGHAADVSSSADASRVVARAIVETGRIDVVVNNAGILRDAVPRKISDQDWEDFLAVHLGGAFRMTPAAVEQFRKRESGRLINVASYSGIRGNRGRANCAAAKAGIIGFTKTAAKELVRFGVPVNAISPNTRMIASIPEENLRDMTAEIPMGRWGEQCEMADAVCFPAWDAAAFITGVVLSVDGGMSM